MTKKLKLLQEQEAADMLGLDLETLRRWEREGKISAVINKRGERRYRKEDVEVLLQKRTR